MKLKVRPDFRTHSRKKNNLVLYTLLYISVRFARYDFSNCAGRPELVFSLVRVVVFDPFDRQPDAIHFRWCGDCQCQKKQQENKIVLSATKKTKLIQSANKSNKKLNKIEEKSTANADDDMARSKYYTPTQISMLNVYWLAQLIYFLVDTDI